MRWPSWLTGAAGVAFLCAALGAAWYVAVRPTTLRVAVVGGGDDARMLGAAAQILRRDGAPVRIKVVPAASPAATAAAIDARTADLAVVRSDMSLPAKGETVAILRREAALLVARADSGIVDVAGLAGRSVALIDANGADQPLLDTILRHYEIPPERVELRHVKAAPPGSGAPAGADAVFVVGAVTERAVADAVKGASGAGAPVFVPIAEAEAIALRRADVEALEIVRGTFGGSPPRPAEPVQTLAVTWRLMAERTLDSAAVAELTRRLFTMRGELARVVPAAVLMEPPDLEKGARLPVHPGAADFFEDEELTFMDKYGDWIYVAAMLLGFGASAIAAVATRMRSRVHRHHARIEHLLTLVGRARAAATPEELDRVEAEADGVVAETLTAAADPPDAARLAALSFALDQVRHAVAEVAGRSSRGIGRRRTRLAWGHLTTERVAGCAGAAQRTAKLPRHRLFCPPHWMLTLGAAVTPEGLPARLRSPRATGGASAGPAGSTRPSAQ